MESSPKRPLSCCKLVGDELVHVLCGRKPREPSCCVTRTCHPPSLGFHVTQNGGSGPGVPLDSKCRESAVPLEPGPVCPPSEGTASRHSIQHYMCVSFGGRRGGCVGPPPRTGGWGGHVGMAGTSVSCQTHVSIYSKPTLLREGVPQPKQGNGNTPKIPS